MRKGLVLTLGVALVLSAVPSFAEAPLLSCMPDIVVSDREDNSQTADNNLFIFSNALDLDEYVEDLDTSDTELLWSFIDKAGSDIRINGVSENAGSLLAPGAANIRSADGVIDIANVAALSAGTTSTATQVGFYASDGTRVTGTTVTITTVNVADNATTRQGDALLVPVLKNWQFDTGADGWGSITGLQAFYGPGWSSVTLNATGGSLVATGARSATGATSLTVIFGSWESTKNPAIGIQPKVGCIMRGRYTLRSTAASAAATPGFRLHANTAHTTIVGGQPIVDFNALDFIDEVSVQYYTYAFVGQTTAARMPGATAKVFELLYFPNQSAEMLLSTDTVTYFMFEYLDTDTPLTGGNDAATFNIDGVVVDAIDRPDLGKGTSFPALTIDNFAASSLNWITKAEPLNLSIIGLTVTPNLTGLVGGIENQDLYIAVQPGNVAFNFEVYTSGSVRVPAEKYMRMSWTLTATVSGNYAEPRVRLGLVSAGAGSWVAHKEQKGGAAISGLTQDPQLWEHWFATPNADPVAGAPAGMTEPMAPRFASYNLWRQDHPTATVAGTLRALSVVTEVFEPQQ